MPKANLPAEGLSDTWGRRNRSLSDRKCPQCGDSFRPRSKRSKYCSRKCAWANNGPAPVAESWWVNKRGYVEGRVLIDGVQRSVKQHRYLVEKSIGRQLHPDEDVHHINGVKTDNHIENLQIVTHSQHTKITNSERTYRRGYKIRLDAQERARRSEWMKSVHVRKKRSRSLKAQTET